MSKETTNAGMLGDLQRLKGSLDDNATDLVHLEGSRLKLGTLLDQASEAFKRQAAFTASRQQASRELKVFLTEALRLATVLRLAVKEHYGIRAEKLAEFGMQPFRGRTRKVKPPETPEEPTPQPPLPRPTDPTL